MRHTLSRSRGVRVYHRSLHSGLAIYFLGVQTRSHFHFLQARCGTRPGPVTRWPDRNARRVRQARLRQYVPLLRRALALASRRARQHQARLRREQRLE